MKDWKGKSKGTSSLITCCFENLVRRSEGNQDFVVQTISENIPSLNERILLKGIFQLKIKMKTCKIRNSHLLNPKEIVGLDSDHEWLLTSQKESPLDTMEKYTII